MSDHVLVLGGARSGKTALAEGLAMRLGTRPAYIATAQALDAEMRARIAAHQEARGGRFTDIEEPLELAGAIQDAAQGHDVILVDCLTLWLTNLLGAEREVTAEVDALAEMLQNLEEQRVIMISNEVGLGIVPDNPLARTFRDLAGWTHQRLAEVCADVHFVVAGLPMTLKGQSPHSN